MKQIRTSPLVLYEDTHDCQTSWMNNCVCVISCKFYRCALEDMYQRIVLILIMRGPSSNLNHLSRAKGCVQHTRLLDGCIVSLRLPGSNVSLGRATRGPFPVQREVARCVSPVTNASETKLGNGFVPNTHTMISSAARRHLSAPS